MSVAGHQTLRVLDGSYVAPLSAAGVPVWVVSSYDGDLVLVPTDRLDEASEVLQAAGHQVRR